MDLPFTINRSLLLLLDLFRIQLGDVENLLGILEAKAQEVAAD